MKKFFLFAIAIVAAMTVNAEQIIFTEVAAKGSLNGKSFSDGELVLSITDEGQNKLEVDSNSCYFGTAEAQEKFALRLKTGGKSQVKEDATNALLLTVPSAGDLFICARTGSNSATDRNVALVQDGDTILNHVLLESEAIKVKGLDTENPDKETNVYPVLSCKVAEGDINIFYPVGAINFYSFVFQADGGQGVENIDATVKAEKRFENGQLVIIKNGVRYNALGTQF